METCSPQAASVGRAPWQAPSDITQPATAGPLRLRLPSHRTAIPRPCSLAGRSSSQVGETTPQSHTVLPLQFAEDFESGTLLKSAAPAGCWDEAESAATLHTMAVSAAAAHRGANGLRVVDARDTTSAGMGHFVSRHVYNGPARYIRSWIRIESSNKLGQLKHSSAWTSGGSLFDTASYLTPPSLLGTGGIECVPRTLRVGCGCHSSGDFDLLAAGLLALLRVTKRRSPLRASRD